MDQINADTLKSLSTILTWATFWLANLAAAIGWFAAQVRSESTRRSDLRVALAEQESAKASSIAARANTRAEELRAENLATQERLVAAERSLEAERTARIKLEHRLAPRQISAEGTRELPSRLANRSHVEEGAITVAVFATSATGEANIFADHLANAVSDCGFSINRNTVHYGRPYALHGVGVLTSDDPEALARGKEFVEALEAAGIAAQALPPRESVKSAEDSPATRLFNLSISLMVGDRPA